MVILMCDFDGAVGFAPFRPLTLRVAKKMKKVCVWGRGRLSGGRFVIVSVKYGEGGPTNL